ncbi:MAG: sigma-70 family RNA polymerase sigma factor [Pirellulales bacterium]
MPSSKDSDEQLLSRAAAGEAAALDELLRQNRQRLKQMVHVQLDARLQARVDPSDVVQEAMIEAARRFPAFLRERPLPFYPWLRQIALDRISRMHRSHLRMARRNLRRETPLEPLLPDDSLQQLANCVLYHGSDPAKRLARKETGEQIREALARLAKDDREVLVLRFLEHLSAAEAAAVMGVSEAALRMRQLRALQRFQKLIGDVLTSED